MKDATGEPPSSALIADISSNGVVTIVDDRRFPFDDGDSVTFYEVKGMVELNNSTPRKIKVLGPYTFEIENVSSYLDARINYQVLY